MSSADVELRLRMETDARVMAELGGPRPRDAIQRAHASSLLQVAAGECWPLKIVPDGAGEAAGTVTVWKRSDEPAETYEIGWMVLTEFQGRGLATQAVREVCDRARRERRFGALNAYPGVTTFRRTGSARRWDSLCSARSRSISAAARFTATTGGSSSSNAMSGRDDGTESSQYPLQDSNLRPARLEGGWPID